jgi:hypothetical protein
MPNEFIARNGLISLKDSTITGSLTVTNGITGSISNAISASYASNGGVTQLLAGPNISLSPTTGVGQVTISSTGGGSNFNTATGSYGSFYSTVTQTNVASTARSMSLNTTDISNGVSISGSTDPFNTYIKTENAGIYNIQFSAQVDKTDSGTDEIWIWLRKNGTNLTDTATSIQLVGNGAHYVAAWNFFVNAAANDYYQLMWYSPDGNVRLHAEPAFGVVPGIPSLIVTVNRIDQFLSNTGSFSGSFTGQFTGSLQGTASWATNAITASYADNFTVAGTITAQKLVVQTITSSVLYSSGSNIFGNDINNTQTFTGSLQITGSVRSTGNIITSGSLNILATTGQNLYFSNTGQIGSSGTGYHIQISPGSNTTLFGQVVTATNGLNVTPGVNSTTQGLVVTSGSYPAATLLRVGVNSLVVTGSNVGIGTLTPTYALDINGTNWAGFRTSVPFQVETTGSNYRYGALVVNNGYNVGGFANNTFDAFSVGQNTGVNNGVGFFRVNLAGGNTTGLYGAAGSNNSLVHINATTTSTLQVTAQNGGIAVIGSTSGATLTTVSAGTNLDLRSDNNGANAGGGIRYYSSINGSNHSHRWFHNASEQMRLTFGGNLGIGTATPAFTLDVSGSGRFTNGLTNTGSLAQLGSSTFNGVISVSPSIHTLTIGQTGANVGSLISLNGYAVNAGIFTLYNSNWGASATFGMYNGINSHIITGAAHIGVNGFRNGSVLRLNVSVAAVTGSSDDIILNISPSYAISSSYSGSLRGIYYAPIFTTSSNSILHRAIETTAGDVLFQSGSTPLFFVSGSGNVGIGTSTPAYRVQVAMPVGTDNFAITNGASVLRFSTNIGSGNPGIASSGVIHFQSPINGTGGTEILQVRKAGSANFIQYWSSNAGTTLSAIDGTGRLGIGTGTTLLSASLHISGASSAALLEIDSSTVNNILFVSGSGNIGIGTGTPNAILDVKGNTIISGSLAVGTGSIGASENTITLGARDAINEGGQIGFNAPGGTYTSASFIDNWQNKARILKGNNTTSTGLIAQWDIHTTQMQLPGYTAASSFPGTATANLAVDSGGNIITVSTSGGTVFPYTGNAVITGSLTATTGFIAPNTNNAMYLRGGDDVELWDINISNHLGIYGQQDATISSIKLGSGGGVISGKSNNIGIGTLTPNAKLDVNGNTIISGSLTVTGSVVITGSVVGNTTALTISSNTASLNLNDGNFFTLQLVSGSNTFINPSNIKSGQTINILLSTTGSATVSFPSTIKQTSGSLYIPTTTTGTDIVTMISFDTASLYLANVKNLI